jgi:hypothetical protein
MKIYEGEISCKNGKTPFNLRPRNDDLTLCRKLLNFDGKSFGENLRHHHFLTSQTGRSGCLAARLATWREQRYQEAQAGPSPVVQRLRAVKAERLKAQMGAQ